MYTSSDRLIVTPLRGPKIIAVLKVEFGPKLVSIDTAARLTRKPLGNQPIIAVLDCTVGSLGIAGVIPRWSGIAMFVR
jgi:hypothetical protein